ncbi:hypothetical protein [Chromobacterium subtsugae]|uniref:hypothetical protein n=1 Tax=Chromobacterium subtsugae TaxID=251747 RepID=UPI000ABA646C|nr:hypothetical protein [Chromobacterium subtsugae]
MEFTPTNQISILFDKRLNCFSASGIMPAGQYLDFIEEVHKENGGIDGQRNVLKTKTAIVIRNRMISDIKNGTILPHIVLGATLSKKRLEELKLVTNNDQLISFILKITAEEISIIDGMQRTAALKQANINGSISNHPIRFELWATEDIGSLIYRMLVLNTGQVPWDIKRQLETVYKQVLKKLKEIVPDMKLIELDDGERRSFAGEYRAALVIEQFLAFTSRSPHVDIKERIAEDFARMDATDILSQENVLLTFGFILHHMYLLDIIFNLYAPALDQAEQEERARFRKGMDIFTSAPACIGFVAAASAYILGESGYDVTAEEQKAKLKTLKTSIEEIRRKAFEANQSGSLENFMDFASLNQKLSVKVGKVGEYEREFFYKAFMHLIENADRLTSLTPCWMTRVK